MFDTIIYSVILFLPVYYGIRRLLDLLTLGRLASRPVLITGCDSGFGHGLAIKCIQNGMPVFAGCLTQQGIDRLRNEVEQLSANSMHLLTTFQVDVASDSSVSAAKQFVDEEITRKKYKGLHALVNNAGIVGNNSWDDWLLPEDYERVWQINTLGVIRCTHAFKPLIKQTRGRIITVASVCGRVALPGIGPYTVSKYAVEAYSDTLRLEMSQFGVKVCMLEPGFFKTPITNVEQNTQMIDKLWARLPSHTQAEYGQKFFEFTRNEVAKNLDCASPKTELVIDAYFHAITAIFPRKRYHVGVDSQFGFIPFSMLSGDIQDWAFWLYALFEQPPKPQQLHS